MADPKRVVERHVEAFNARDADAEPWSDDAEFVAPNASVHGREEVLGFLGVFWDAFPDGRLETSGLLAEGSVVAAEGRFIGTHTGVMRTPAGDVAATGRHCSCSGACATSRHTGRIDPILGRPGRGGLARSGIRPERRVHAKAEAVGVRGARGDSA
jgi:predicted ester cyclase